MSDRQRRPGVLDLNPALAHLRAPVTDLCWWCGDVATTEEHRFKASTLRRVARSDDGTVEPSNIFKKRDRKSTRLNSSHVSISYAVFCLKKKNKHKITSTKRK